MNLGTYDLGDLHDSKIFHRKVDVIKSTQKRNFVDTQAAQCEKDLFTFNFRLLDHLREHVMKIFSEEYLEAIVFQNFSFAINNLSARFP